MTVSLRDLHMPISNSCNCRCFSKRIHIDTQIYVSSKGKVVPFDHKRVKNEETSLRRCISNLTHLVQEMALQNKRDKEHILKTIEDRVCKLSEENPVPITAQMMQQIVTIIHE